MTWSLGALATAVALVTVHARPAVVPSGSTSAGPIVDVGYASFLGSSSVSGVDFFGGIPYVQPPLGQLRWRAPQPLDESPVKGGNVTVYDARTFGNFCLQQPAQIGFGSDDCLTLNIWKPAKAKRGDKLPVVVYIHGGGNYYASARAFPMDSWVSISKGSVVAVNLQYRLGLLGFLASKAIMSDGSVNAGLLDQRAALEWIQRHISKFGGDPNQVIVVGESAGGGDIVYHMTAYGGTGKPLFKRAITQSIGTDPIPSVAEYEFCFANVTATVGCTGTDPLACLRAAPLESIVRAINNKPSTCKFLPVIDGALITDYPSRLVAQGKIQKVDYLGGHCTDDGSIFVGDPAYLANTTEGFVAAIKRRYTTLSNSSVERMIKLYPGDSFTSTFERSKTAFGDTIFTCQDWFIADKLRTLGVRNVYNYRWNTPDPTQYAVFPWKGVMHTADLFFLFNGTNSGPNPSAPQSIFTPLTRAEATLSTEAIGYWTAFGRRGDPSINRPLRSSSKWADASKGRLLIQEESATKSASVMEKVSAIHEERCRFWNEIGSEIGL